MQEAPAFPNVHYAYGRFLLATEDLESGIQEFLKEIETHPEHVRARMQVAAARYRVDSAAGLPFAREVVKLAPDYPFGHYLLGLLYFDTGDIARAIPELEDRRAHGARGGAVPVRARQRLRESGPRRRRRAGARGLHSTQARTSRPSHAANDALRRLDLDSATDAESAERKRHQKLNLACSSIVRPASPSCASPKCSFRMSAWMFFRLILLNRL